MFGWRPVLEGKAQRWEIEERWSFDDLLECHEVLDAWIEAQRKASKKE